MYQEDIDQLVGFMSLDLILFMFVVPSEWCHQLEIWNVTDEKKNPARPLLDTGK